jgi:hypothetical protein
MSKFERADRFIIQFPWISVCLSLFFLNLHIFGLYESITKISLWVLFGNRSLKRTEIMIFRILFTSYFLFFELIVTRALGSTLVDFV